MCTLAFFPVNLLGLPSVSRLSLPLSLFHSLAPLPLLYFSFSSFTGMWEGCISGCRISLCSPWLETSLHSRLLCNAQLWAVTWKRLREDYLPPHPCHYLNDSSVSVVKALGYCSDMWEVRSWLTLHSGSIFYIRIWKENTVLDMCLSIMPVKVVFVVYLLCAHHTEPCL